MKTLKMIYAVTSLVTIFASTSAISAPDALQLETVQPLRVPVLEKIDPTFVNALAAAAKDYKTFHGSICQPYSGSQQKDIDHRDNGLYNKGTGTRTIVCPIVRDNVNKTWGFWTNIYVKNPSKSNFTCWVDSRGTHGQVVQWKSKSTNIQGNQTLTIDIQKMVQNGSFNLYCRVPKNGRIASYRTGEILKTDSNN
jgi:hypothetical protein